MVLQKMSMKGEPRVRRMDVTHRTYDCGWWSSAKKETTRSVSDENNYLR